MMIENTIYFLGYAVFVAGFTVGLVACVFGVFFIVWYIVDLVGHK